MSQIIYGIVKDNSYGPADMLWFRSLDIANSLTDPDSKNFSEEFNMNEQGVVKRLEFPDDLNLEKCGFYLSDDNYDFHQESIFNF